MKDKQISRFQKKPERLFGLLRDSLLDDSDSIEEDGQPNDSLRDLLERYLETTVVLGDRAKTPMSTILTHVSREVSDAQGLTVQHFLFDPKTDVGLLEDIKQDSKQLATQGNTEFKKKVGIVLYYGAIASGLVYQHERISSYSLAEIDIQLKRLLEKPWIVPELRGLFGEAIDVCRHMDESVD